MRPMQGRVNAASRKGIRWPSADGYFAGLGLGVRLGLSRAGLCAGLRAGLEWGPSEGPG